jgi:hypothetical protein
MPSIAAHGTPASAAAARELQDVKRENDNLVSQLVAKQLEVALLQEKQVRLFLQSLSVITSQRHSS